jgi:hypothetical protein
MSSYQIWKTLETSSEHERYGKLHRQLKQMWWRAFRMGAAVGCIAGFVLWYIYMAGVGGGINQ